MDSRCLIVIPVHNEERHLVGVLEEVIDSTDQDILAVDDGSDDRSTRILEDFEYSRDRFELIRNDQNKGYGYSLLQGFDYSISNEYKYVLTLDGDGQHTPRLIPKFVRRINSKEADIVSGSRYMPDSEKFSDPPSDRLEINREITCKINQMTVYNLTDAFCGYKIYKCDSIKDLEIKNTGFGMPLELLLKADRKGLSIAELPVPLIYKEPLKGFNGRLSDPEKRLNYYYEVIKEVACSRSS